MNTKLGGIDRIASGIAGIGLILYALLGGLDKTWLQVTMIVIGAAFAIGAVGGT